MYSLYIHSFIKFHSFIHIYMMMELLSKYFLLHYWFMKIKIRGKWYHLTRLWVFIWVCPWTEAETNARHCFRTTLRLEKTLIWIKNKNCSRPYYMLKRVWERSICRCASLQTKPSTKGIFCLFSLLELYRQIIQMDWARNISIKSFQRFLFIIHLMIQYKICLFKYILLFNPIGRYMCAWFDFWLSFWFLSHAIQSHSIHAESVELSSSSPSSSSSASLFLCTELDGDGALRSASCSFFHVSPSALAKWSSTDISMFTVCFVGGGGVGSFVSARMENDDVAESLDFTDKLGDDAGCGLAFGDGVAATSSGDMDFFSNRWM